MLLQEFDRRVAAARASLAKATDAEMNAPWTLKHGGHDIFTLPRVAAIRSFVMNHLIHHRGQLWCICGSTTSRYPRSTDRRRTSSEPRAGGRLSLGGLPAGRFHRPRRRATPAAIGTAHRTRPSTSRPFAPGSIRNSSHAIGRSSPRRQSSHWSTSPWRWSHGLRGCRCRFCSSPSTSRRSSCSRPPSGPSAGNCMPAVDVHRATRGTDAEARDRTLRHEYTRGLLSSTTARVRPWRARHRVVPARAHVAGRAPRRCSRCGPSNHRAVVRRVDRGRDDGRGTLVATGAWSLALVLLQVESGR